MTRPSHSDEIWEIKLAPPSSPRPSRKPTGWRLALGGGLLLAALVLVVWPGRWIPTVAAWLAGRWTIVAAFVLASAGAALLLSWARRRPLASPTPPLVVRPMSERFIVVSMVTVLTVGVTATVILGLAGSGTSTSAGLVGTASPVLLSAAVVALLLRLRRTRSTEQALQLQLEQHRHTEHDATQRRLTEEHAKAAALLDSGQAPVRQAGLLALERLGQNHASVRQGVVDQLCAYLRMPFTPPPAAPARPRRTRRPGQLTAPTRPTATHVSAGHEAAQRELQVRLTAQQILARNLYPTHTPAQPDGASTYWSLIRVDLTGAVLVGFDLSSCLVAQAVFTGAHFYGTTTFDHATFAVLDLTDAQFHGDVMLTHIVATAQVLCTGIDVAGTASFDHASGLGAFERACFRGPASFVGTRFQARATFAHAAFHAPVRFSHATGEPQGMSGRPTVDFTDAVFHHDVTSAGFTGFTDARIGGPITAPVQGPLADHLRAAGWTVSGRHDTPPPASTIWHQPEAVRLHEDDLGAVYLTKGTETWQLGSQPPASGSRAPDAAWSSAAQWWRGTWAPSEQDGYIPIDEPEFRDRARHLATFPYKVPVDWKLPFDLHRIPQTPAAVAFLATPELRERTT